MSTTVVVRMKKTSTRLLAMNKLGWYRVPVGLLLAVTVVLSASAQGITEPVDDDAIALIREQGLENSHVMEYLYYNLAWQIAIVTLDQWL